jgi:hypothetical protein
VTSAKTGQREQAYHILLDVIELDRYNETAWLWLSTVTDSPDDERICLDNVLTINPDNAFAHERLAVISPNGRGLPSTHILCPKCGAGNRDFVRECAACGYSFFRRCPVCGEVNEIEAPECSQCGTDLAPAARPADHPTGARAGADRKTRTSAPLTIWPVVAFWVSTSLLFLGGGAASLIEFATTLLYNRGSIQSLKPIELAWLPMGLFFLIFGFTGLGLAWQLARRRPGGYYGSLIFGLVLIVLGPAASLILDPPDYGTTACTGLMPAAAIMLTLASMAGFESKTRYS